MNERILLWDLGNVVVQWSPDEILKQLDYTAEQSVYLRESLFGHGDWLDLDRGVTTEAEVAQRLVSESNLSLEQALRCFDVVRHTLIDIEESVDLIKELVPANIPMYVLSNMSLANADAGSVLFIDDTMENIEAAQKQGMEGLHFKGSADCYAQIRQFVEGA